MTAPKILLISAGIILLIMFILPLVTMGILNTGNIIGLTLGGMLIVYGIFFNEINGFAVYLANRMWGKVIIILFSALVLALLTFTVIITVNIVIRANNPPKNETTVVVLGCRVRESGASTMLKTRLNATLAYLTKNPEVNCVLSGGKGEDEPIAEAEYMYNWLTERGIEPARLYIENRSTSTEENLRFTKELIAKEGLIPEITIITNEFHQYRAYRFAKESGFEGIYSYSAKTPFSALPTYYIREVCGVAHMIFID